MRQFLKSFLVLSFFTTSPVWADSTLFEDARSLNRELVEKLKKGMISDYPVLLSRRFLLKQEWAMGEITDKAVYCTSIKVLQGEIEAKSKARLKSGLGDVESVIEQLRESSEVRAFCN